MEFKEDGKRRVISVDIDGVLTESGQFWNNNVVPNKRNIERVKELYKQGNIIIIWTARQWCYAPLTVGWLITNEVPFHGIVMGKGGSDCYIDDKSTNFESLLGDVTKVYESSMDFNPLPPEQLCQKKIL